ncbi:LysR family transcriptional regulator [Dyella mobilis]|uniref:LysR family transcriptional regulator n=1 Tax=Dyella mobilis TaxID=1849582 RepID=A0ABS2KC47_9GAMM|nr:LysR family transcriptional regulator [Dyella mobilis]MBM7128761.1 LysR family transcriptional regulator [Dyella mobilis]GLQ99091.1 LysR family transcriptional regulator [Dyella mobilis]
MDRLDVMRLFTRIVERQSFTLAAQDLDWPRSTATQVIKDLEKRLGVRLLQRTTRHVKATLDGEAYYRRCITILGDVEDAEAAFSDAKPRGLLRVDVHGTLARHFLLPALPGFLTCYPNLQLHIGEGDRLVDLVREGVDCVLRVGDLQDSAMVGRRVALLDEVTCASPSYVARHGNPRSIDELAGHVSIGFISSASGMALPLEFTVNGTLRNITLPSTVTVTSAETYVMAAKLGLGLIQVPRYHVQADLAAGALISVLPDFPASPTPVSLLYPHSRQLSPRVRVFIDWVTQELATPGENIRP